MRDRDRERRGREGVWLTFPFWSSNSTKPIPLRSPVSLSVGSLTWFTFPYLLKVSVSAFLTPSSPNEESKPFTKMVFSSPGLPVHSSTSLGASGPFLRSKGIVETAARLPFARRLGDASSLDMDCIEAVLGQKIAHVCFYVASCLAFSNYKLLKLQ